MSQTAHITWLSFSQLPGKANKAAECTEYIYTPIYVSGGWSVNATNHSFIHIIMSILCLRIDAHKYVANNWQQLFESAAAALQMNKSLTLSVVLSPCSLCRFPVCCCVASLNEFSGSPKNKNSCARAYLGESCLVCSFRFANVWRLDVFAFR